jgi:hypothetical protein
MGILGNMGLMGSELKKIISEQKKISSTLFKIISEKKIFISELFFLISGVKKRKPMTI